jgi:hypothetical protein
MLLEYYGL